jgi:hypothetical protein
MYMLFVVNTGTLLHPVSVAVSPNGQVVVSDSERNAIIVFRSCRDDAVLRTLDSLMPRFCKMGPVVVLPDPREGLVVLCLQQIDLTVAQSALGVLALAAKSAKKAVKAAAAQMNLAMTLASVATTVSRSKGDDGPSRQSKAAVQLVMHTKTYRDAVKQGQLAQTAWNSASADLDWAKARPLLFYRLKDGAFLKQLGVVGHASGMEALGALTMTNTGSLYVTDANTGRVLHISPAGQVIAWLDPQAALISPCNDIVGALAGAGSLTGIAWRPSTCELLLVDGLHHRVLVLPNSGRGADVRLSAIGQGRLKSPVGLAIMASGQLWVADAGNCRLCAFH